MQKHYMLFLMFCGNVYAMDLTTPSSSQLMIAAWVVTDQTPFEKYSEFCVSHNSNDTKSITYTCRPKGKFLIPCPQKSLLEIQTSTNGVLTFLLKQQGEQIELSQVPEQSWYKHPAVTHGAAVLSTILVIVSFLR
jgi:hypothetical protein